MKNLIYALGNANLTESVVETILTEIELWIDSKVHRSEQKMKIESISPIQKENESIRMELRILSDTVKNGFEKMDQKWEERFIRSDQKLEFFRKSLESQISSTRENLELQINANRENSIMQTARLERQISYTRENLETQIKANDKQLGLIQKLLWLLLTLVLGMFAKVVHLI